MPLISEEQPLGFLNTLTTPDAPVNDGPELLDVMAAAYRQENSLSSAIARGNPKFVDVPEYDAFEDLKGYEDNIDSFVMSRSPEETAYIKNRIDQEKSDVETVRAGGATGILSMMAAGLTDPLVIPTLFAGSGMVRGGSIGMNAIRAGMVGGASEIAPEFVKNITQETRTLGQSATYITGAALLSGVFGAGLSKLEKASFDKMADDLDAVLNPNIENIPSPDLSNAAPRSMGAAQVGQLTDEQLKTVKVFGVSDENAAKLESYGLGWLKYFGVMGLEKIPVSPLVRMATSRVREPKAAVAKLLESPLVMRGNKEGLTAVPIEGAAETEIKAYQTAIYDFRGGLTSDYKEYRKRVSLENKQAIVNGTEKQPILDYQQFRVEVGKSARRDDKHIIPEVQRSAEHLRSRVLDPMKDDAIKLKLLPENVDVTTAKSYLMRVYNHNKIIARRNEWDAILEGWLKSNRADDLAKLNRYKLKGKKIPDELLEKAYVSDAEIKEAVQSLTDNILGEKSGRMPYKANANVRGPLKERVLNIQDRHIEDFLESDADIVASQYVNTMGPDIALSRRFGDVDLKDVEETIKEEYKKLIDAAKTEKQRTKLHKEMRSDLEDLAAVRDRLRGNYKVPESPDGFAVRAGRSLRALNFLRMLGGMTISAMTDPARFVSVNGMQQFGKGLKVLAMSPKTFNLARNEIKKAGVGLDMVLNSTAISHSNMEDIYANGSKFERGIQYSTDAFGKLSLMTQWNTAMKQFGGVITQDRILDVAKQLVDGTISNGDLTRLAQSGISKEMAERISAQFKLYGDDVDGLLVSGGHMWDDQEALKSLQNAILKDVDRTIVTVGTGEKPLWTSSELGKMIFQFKSFAASAHHKVLLAGLQHRDAREIEGLIMSIALGTMVYGLKQANSGQEISDDPKKLALEGFDRSGSMGYFLDVNNITEKMTGGKVGLNAMIGGEPMSRYASRNVVGALEGPSFGTVGDIIDVVGMVSRGEVSESEIHKIRGLIPAQNLFYLRTLFDKLEGIAAEEIAK